MRTLDDSRGWRFGAPSPRHPKQYYRYDCRDYYNDRPCPSGSINYEIVYEWIFDDIILFILPFPGRCILSNDVVVSVQSCIGGKIFKTPHDPWFRFWFLIAVAQHWSCECGFPIYIRRYRRYHLNHFVCSVSASSRDIHEWNGVIDFAHNAQMQNKYDE